MGKQSKAKKYDNNIGKGKVTPAQIAFIVDQYLLDNTFTQTRSSFRSEASDLISKSPAQAPKSLLSLAAMLDEYIRLKEQKVMMDHEKSSLEQEKIRVQTLLRGMQAAMNSYTSAGPAIAPLPLVSSSKNRFALKPPQIDRITATGSPTGLPIYNTPAAVISANTLRDPTNFSTPVTVNPNLRKRKNSKDSSNASIATKMPRITSSTNTTQPQGSGSLVQQINLPRYQETASTIQLSPIQGSNVAKRLFNSSSPNTPPKSHNSQTEKSISPLENSITSNSYSSIMPQQITSTNRTVITSETIRVSPMKQVSYYSIERNHCISSSPVRTNIGRQSKREHVKGRLDFDGSDTIINSVQDIPCEISPPESVKEVEMFNLDLPNLDAFGDDFSLSEFLLDFDFDESGISYSQPATDSSPESLSGSPNTAGDFDMGSNQIMSELSSTVTEFYTEQDMNTQGPDSVTSMKSTTKCVKILSPVKNQRSPMDQENLYTKE